MVLAVGSLVEAKYEIVDFRPFAGLLEACQRRLRGQYLKR